MKKCLWIPTLETKRLFLRELTSDDADDLRKWPGPDIVYKYWGHAAGKGEKNPELLFIDPRPHVKHKPSHDFIWGIVSKENNKVIGIIEVFDVENDRLRQRGLQDRPRFLEQGYLYRSVAAGC